MQRSVVAQSGPFSKGVQEEQHVQGTPCCRDCSPWSALLLGTQQYQQAPSEPMCSCWFNKYRTNLDCMSIPESSVKQFHLQIPQQRSRTQCHALHITKRNYCQYTFMKIPNLSIFCQTSLAVCVTEKHILMPVRSTVQARKEYPAREVFSIGNSLGQCCCHI